MSKGLDLIKRQQPEIIDGFPTGNIYIGVTKEELTELENELKRLEELEKAFDTLSKDHEKAMKELSKEIEKNRAFEIIKRKLPPLMRSTLLDYCNKEEYDVLKEVLL